MMRDPPQRLGRGLASLLGDMRDPSVIAGGELPVSALDAGSFQPRRSIEPQGLADLVASVRSHGILQPLLVRPHPRQSNRYQIIAGERRWRAALEVGLERVPCLVRTLSDAEATAAALVENLQRVDLNAIEEAEGFRRLVDEFELSHEDLGRIIGKSRSHIANALRLLGLPPTVADYVRNGSLTAGHARAALACADPAIAADEMIARHLTVRQAEALSHEVPRIPKSQRKHRVADPNLAAISQELSERLGMLVTVSVKGGGGVVKVTYRSLDQLDYLIAHLSRP